MSSQQCTYCGSNSDILKPISAGMKLALHQAEDVDADTLPPEVCDNCFNKLNGKVSQGAKLRAESIQKQKNKADMWKNRVQFVKKARILMGQKSFIEAARNYEKYLHVLEVAHNLEKGQLSPEIFSNSKKSKEMTVITSTYWDLFRIYDQSGAYQDKMSQTGQKLAKFVPYSTIFPDVMKKAESFQRSAKNPAIVKEFIRASGGKKGGGCFIATAAFDSPYAYEVKVLRQFREVFLRPHKPGRLFIKTYYRLSPRLANHINRSPLLKHLVRAPLCVIVKIASLSLKRP